METHHLRTVGPIAGERLAPFRVAVEGHRTMEQVARWVFQQAPALDIADVIRQDEFTHDVLVPFADGLTLVYDST